MKSIINRKSYDTENAKLLANWSNGARSSDFRWCAEDLYVTNNGAYFLHGQGGPMSPYSRSAGLNSWIGGEAIVSLTRDQAIDWLERTENVEILQAEFPDVVEQA